MAINWAPTTAEEIAQNIKTLVKTAPGTVPLARSMGTPQDLVDQPQSVVASRLSAGVIKAVRTYEPRARVTRVRFEGDTNGQLTVKVEWEGVR